MCLPNKIKEQVMRTSVCISIKLCIYADHKQWISFNINMISLLAKLMLFSLSHTVQYILDFYNAISDFRQSEVHIICAYWFITLKNNNFFLEVLLFRLKSLAVFTALHFLVHRKRSNFAFFLLYPTSLYTQLFAINFNDLRLSRCKRGQQARAYCFITYLVRIENQSISAGTVVN